ncbi:hypothetical protein RND81_05G084000 [Saponaria officinalis]|uniref:C2 domain-containing protein n=1 Tax=Saponaria officinalis TaxID=3572 RepID=A0AAW1KYS6_SAPOF
MHPQYSQQRMLEINVISAEDLRINGRPIKNNAIAHVRLNNDTEVASTRVDKNGGSYPLWNDKIDLKFPCNAKEIIVQVCCDNNLIGQTIIPAKDIIEDYIPSSYLHLLSYRLRDRQSRRNGIINLSIRVRDC